MITAVAATRPALCKNRNDFGMWSIPGEGVLGRQGFRVRECSTPTGNELAAVAQRCSITLPSTRMKFACTGSFSRRRSRSTGMAPTASPTAATREGYSMASPIFSSMKSMRSRTKAANSLRRGVMRCSVGFDAELVRAEGFIWVCPKWGALSMASEDRGVVCGCRNMARPRDDSVHEIFLTHQISPQRVIPG
jgi:hypothetical protein